MRGIRLGYFGARGDHRGLCIQSTETCKALEPDAVFAIDMAHLSPYPCDWSDYRQSTLSVHHIDTFTPDDVRAWCEGIDVVLGAETFYRPWVTSIFRECGVRSVLVCNVEFSAHVLADDWAPRPDVMAVATDWEMGRIPGAVVLPHGVNRDRLPFRRRTEAKTFLHVVGHSAAQDRQGSRILFEALTLVTHPMRVVVTSQRDLSVSHRPARCVDLEVRDADVPCYWALYDDADVLVHPRRYGGLSLPMMEALSSGMPVLMPDASPQNGPLPPGMLLPCATWRTLKNTSGEFPMHDIDPRALAATMDRLAATPSKVDCLSDQADAIAEQYSWPNLLPRYETLFLSLL
jgi:glycosyltransferase involved in cell wall biosynthesis